MKVALRCDNLTVNEAQELAALLQALDGVDKAYLMPARGVMQYRMPQAAMGAFEILLVLSSGLFGATAVPFLKKGSEAFFDELGAEEWFRAAARYLKSLHKRPAPYEPEITLLDAEAKPLIRLSDGQEKSGEQ